MAPDDEAHWQLLIEGLRSGDSQAVRRFCDEYGAQLHRVAEKHLPGAIRRRVGAEDVVQSVCRTFFRRAGGGEFQLADSESLWRLLCAITLTKVREQTRFHLRQKRGIDQEVPAAPFSGQDSAPGYVPVDRRPNPAAAAEFADQFQQVIATLDDEERQVVDLKLQECTNEEVAERMQCSERTVRRILKRAQARLGRAFEVPGT
jgi:RNA polymerase sigma factor (sigma-70 family)